MAKASDAVLFCPFCRESFEDESECPQHGIPLVPFQQLDSFKERSMPSADEIIDLSDPRFGRGLLALASVAMLIGFFLPWLNILQQERSATGMVLTQRALNLWLVPIISFTWLSILLRRRTLRTLAGSRVAVAALALIAAGSMIYSAIRIHNATLAIAERTGLEGGVSPKIGFLLSIGAAVVALIASRTLGVAGEDRRQVPRFNV